MNKLKKLVSMTLAGCMATSSLLMSASASNITTTSNIAENNSAVLYADLNDYHSYEQELNNMIANPDIEHIIVLDNESNNVPVLTNDEAISTCSGTTYHTYRLAGKKDAGTYTDKNNRLVTLSGTPGDQLVHSVTYTVSRKYSCNVSAITPSKISAFVGYDVTNSISMHAGVNSTVPSTYNGKTVTRMELRAYPIYAVTKFTVQRQLHKNSLTYPWEACGSGRSETPNGIYYDKSYTCK